MVCRIVVAAFALAYAAALLLLGAGAWGWFGVAPAPLSGAYLLLLGLPWNPVAYRSLGMGGPIPGLLTPTINLALLVGMCMMKRRTQR